MAGTYVEPHTPALGGADPAAVAAAEQAHAEGETAAQARRDHYHANARGLGACAGDPMPAESALQPPPTSPPRIYQQPGEPGQP
jgi:hypothetical protein